MIRRVRAWLMALGIMWRFRRLIASSLRAGWTAARETSKTRARGASGLRAAAAGSTVDVSELDGSAKWTDRSTWDLERPS